MKKKNEKPPLYVSKADQKVGNVIAIVKVDRGQFTSRERDILARIFKKHGLLENVNIISTSVD